MERRWLVMATAAASAFALALGVITAMWLGAKSDLSESRETVDAKSTRIEALVGDLETADADVSFLEGEVSGLEGELAGAEDVIAQAQSCIGAIVSFSAPAIRAAVSDCTAVARYR
ncbi:MAG: hypothetical protein ACRDJP_09700 [Actinomycetota bacterium]